MVYIYDSSTGKLYIGQFGFGAVTDEEQVEHFAKEEGMNLDHILWGRVNDLQIELNDH